MISIISYLRSVTPVADTFSILCRLTTLVLADVVVRITKTLGMLGLWCLGFACLLDLCDHFGWNGDVVV